MSGEDIRSARTKKPCDDAIPIAYACPESSTLF